ncbi:MAG: ketopantoate reductase family protein [Chitinophagaceae bacterium]|nr:ketopantoate reductase family protein [Oligoflexus sp.]
MGLESDAKSDAVAIVGSGAVGQMLAYFLKKANITTVLCYGKGGVRSVVSKVKLRNAVEHFETESDGPLPQLWFFTVKAYDLKAALDQWLLHIPRTAKIVILSNGYIEDEVAPFRKVFPASNIRKGVVSRGAKFAEDGSLEISSKGSVIWGGAIHTISPLEDAIFEALKDEGFAWSKDACDARKEKWYFNTVLNTLAGVYQLARNGDVPALAEYPLLCHEVYVLGSVLWPDWKAKEDELKTKLDALVVMTAQNENSMAADIRLKRPTEAAYLSGHVKTIANAATLLPQLYCFNAKLSG